MKEEQKYDWSYSIGYFITIYPIFIISNWITEGWSNMKFGEIAIVSALSSVLITILFHIIQKYKQRRKSQKQEK